MVKEIPLTQGKVALVDDDDYEWLSQRRWYYSRDGHTGYAIGCRTKYEPDRPTTPRMHRIIMNPPPGMEIDHRNMDGLDNRRCNLRICTKSQNNMNRRKRAGCSSQYKGVNWDKREKKWRARIRIDGKKRHLGYFDSEEEAASAYNTVAKGLFGEFARLNELHTRVRVEGRGELTPPLAFGPR